MLALAATATNPHIFWITSRAAGTAALFLSSAGVCVGLLMGGRFVRGRGTDLRALHEALSLATIGALLAWRHMRSSPVSGGGGGGREPRLSDQRAPA